MTLALWLNEETAFHLGKQGRAGTDPSITTTLQAWLLPWQPFGLPNKGSHHSSTDGGFVLSRLPVSSQFILTTLQRVSYDYLHATEREEGHPTSTSTNISNPESSQFWASS